MSETSKPLVTLDDKPVNWKTIVLDDGRELVPAKPMIVAGDTRRFLIFTRDENITLPGGHVGDFTWRLPNIGVVLWHELWNLPPQTKEVIIVVNATTGPLTR